MPASSFVPLPRRVAVTGLGLVTPLGVGRDETWRGLLAGRRAVRWLDEPLAPVAGLSVPSSPRLFGARVPLEIPSADRLVSFAKLAAREAAAHAGLSGELLREAACVIGTSKIDLQQLDVWLGGGEDREFRSPVTEILFPSHAASAVAAELHCQGAVLCPVAACATGLLSIIRAAHLIQSGDCAIALAGGADSSLHAGVLASYRRLGVLAHPGDSPGECCRPFDRHRTGFAVGEGAGILVLEDWEHAVRRGARILAEWGDGLIASESMDLVRTDGQGRVLHHTIRRLLERQGISAADLSGVSVHGTGTLLNDRAEGAALECLAGRGGRPLDVFGIKGAIGHLMGAAGAVETAVCILALIHQQLPPTVNHQCKGADLAALPLRFHRTEPQECRFLLKLSLGFGGVLAVALLKAC